MAKRYASLARCSDLTERDLVAALISRDECAALLERIAKMPAERASTRAFLGLLARLATPACTWLEGELAVELFDDEGGTKVRVMSEIGAGYRERVLPVVVLAQSNEDIVALVERGQQLGELFRIERVSSRCVLLLASDAADEVGATEFDISETSLGWAAGAGATNVEDVDSGWDDASNA